MIRRTRPHSSQSRALLRRPLRVEPLEDRRMLSVLFVDIDAADGGDGLAWSTAYRDLQEALDRAAEVNGDGIGENDVDRVWIAEGTYRPSVELEPGSARSASFSLVDGVTLCGGFAGIEATLEERDIAVHVTTLSGDLGTIGNSSDNAHTVVYCGADTEAALDGLSITDGNANLSYSSNHPERNYGGGIYSTGSLTVTDVTLSGNSAKGDGGGICNYGTLTVVSSTLSGNSAGYGGGICHRQGTLTVMNSTFSENSSGAWGGAIFNSRGTMTVANSTFLGNSATSSTLGRGGAIFNDQGTLGIVNGTFSHNSAAHTAGAVFNSGTLTVTTGTFSGNSSVSRGGGISSSGELTLTNATFLGNSAGENGGAISAGTLSVTNSTFSGNSSGEDGGAISAGTLTLTNSTLSGNSAKGWGDGIDSGSLTLFNSILWQNDHRDIDDTNRISGANNLVGIDPRFVRNPSDGGDGWGDDPDTPDVDESANDDYGDLHLTSRSPAVNYGDDALAVDAEGNPLTTDRDGNVRRYAGSTADVGAFEFQGEVAAGREAASLVTTTSEDVVDLYDGQVSLREAIYYAGTGSLGSTVTFDETLGGATILLSGRSFWIDKGLTVDASSLSSPTVNADLKSRVFTVVARQECPVELNHLTIAGGSGGIYGGGIYNSGTLILRSGTLLGNHATYGGGAFNAGTLTVTNSVLSENSGSHGAGIHNDEGTLTLTNSELSGNSGYVGGAAYNDHGYLTFTDCTLSDNSTSATGGGIFNEGTLTSVRSTFLGNSARRYGGAIYSYSGTLTLMNSTLSGNSAGDYGGAIRNSGGLTSTNSTFSGNSAGKNGGAIYNTSTLTMTNSVLTGNRASSSGGGIYGYDGTLTLHNSIVAKNENPNTPDIARSSGTLAGSNNLIGDGTGQSNLVDGQDGNLVGTAENPIDPLFIRNPSDGGDGWGDDPSTPDIDESANDDYGDLRLRSDSPAIDAGDNALLPADEFDLDGDGDTTEPIPVDLAGSARVVDGNNDGTATVDMGAYEFLAGLPGVPGDLNADGTVSGADLDIIRANWGQSVTPGSLSDGDPSGDGTVGGADLDIVRANWGQTAPAASVAPTEEDGMDEPGVGADVYGPIPEQDSGATTARDHVFAGAESLADAAWTRAVQALQTRREKRESRALDVILLGWGE